LTPITRQLLRFAAQVAPDAVDGAVVVQQLAPIPAFHVGGVSGRLTRIDHIFEVAVQVLEVDELADVGVCREPAAQRFRQDP